MIVSMPNLEAAIFLCGGCKVLHRVIVEPDGAVDLGTLDTAARAQFFAQQPYWMELTIGPWGVPVGA